MKEILIVAHGSPSAPVAPQAALTSLAARVQALRPGDRIGAATLAQPGALAAALATMRAPAIYPFFMAEGWFTRTELPRRLAELGSAAPILPPFGTDPGLVALIRTVLTEAGAEAGADQQVILVAHGSRRARRSRDSAHDMAEALRGPGRPQIHVALIEEPPFLVEVAREIPRAFCLPFFALRAGHVTGDIPEALAEAGFRGRLLPEIGADPRVPELIAAAIGRA